MALERIIILKTHEINFNLYPRIIIQIESLYRVQCDTNIDLLVLDESESIFDQFLSSTMKHLRPCVATFEWLLQSANRCLAMDANLCDRTVSLIRRVRGIEDEMLIVNDYKNMSNDNIEITENKEVLNSQILNSVRNGKNIIIPTNSKRFADTIHKLITTDIPKEKVLLITSETSDDDKTVIFSDVNTIWKQYQVVIFTPTCSAGISFTQVHFEELFGYFTNTSTVVESWRQSMYRARDISAHKYSICIETNGDHSLVANVNEMKDNIKTNFNMMSQEAEELDYKLALDGAPVFVEDLLFDIWAWTKYIQNISRARPIETFVEQCALTGATMKLMEAPVEENMIQKYTAAASEIKQANFDNIINAREVTGAEFNEINIKLLKTADDKHAMDKYMLRKSYRWKGTVDIEFMETYANKRVVNVFKNLTDILQSDSTRTSLENIREYRKDTKEGLSTIYSRHKIACDLLSVCGYTGILDTQEITRDTIMQKLEAKKNNIMKEMGVMCYAFGSKEKMKEWKFRSILDFINGILFQMYGIKIIAVSTNKRNHYNIKHSLYGVIFDKVISDVKPYIEPNWKYKIIEDPFAEQLNI